MQNKNIIAIALTAIIQVWFFGGRYAYQECEAYPFPSGIFQANTPYGVICGTLQMSYFPLGLPSSFNGTFSVRL